MGLAGGLATNGLLAGGGGAIGSAQWERIYGDMALPLAGGVVQATYLHCIGGLLAVAAATSAEGAFYLDPAQYSGAPQLRVRGDLITNAVAPLATFTYGLYPILTWGGASGLYPTVATVGAALGATPSIAAPPASGPRTPVVGAPFAFPSAGWYALGVAVSGVNVAASANTMHNIELDMQGFPGGNPTEIVNTVGAAGAAQTIPDPSASGATYNKLTLSAPLCTLTFPTPAGVCSFTLELIQDGSGGRGVTFPSVKWAGMAGAPTLSTAAGATDLFTFLWDGTSWLAFASGLNMG